MIAAVLFVAVPLLPAVLAPLLFLRAGRHLLPLVPWIPAAGLVLLPLRDRVIELPWLLLGARLGIDATALPLLLLAIIAWTIAGWHARRTIAIAEQGRFFFFWLMTWCGNFCVFLTLDGASFYAAYALMTVAAYGLIVHRRRPEDYRAGRVYLTMALIGEGLLIAALFLLAVEAGNPALEAGPELVAATSRPHLIAVLMLTGFGIKMGLAGLHMWLPLAHPQAPVPASAVLSGVMLKAGLIGWLRFLPLGQEDFEILGLVMLLAGLVTVFFGTAVGLAQRRIKGLLAYSSVSQMGLVAAIVALALLHPDQAVTYVGLATLFALHHGLAKSALFLGVDLIATSPLLARRLLWIPAASLAGLPLTSGALAKAAWKSALPFDLAAISPWLMASSVLTTLLMARFLVLAWPRGSGAGWRPARPWLAMLAASLVVPWVYTIAAAPVLIRVPFQPVYLIETLAPVLAGTALALLAAWLWKGRAIPYISEGDVLALLPQRPAALRMPPWQPWRPRWQPPLARLENVLGSLTPALLLGALLLGAAVALGFI
jgi:formate hydrogenlyase subunit 3/multisubunit Na+/H+ antiporter MnhD subunit